MSTAQILLRTLTLLLIVPFLGCDSQEAASTAAKQDAKAWKATSATVLPGSDPLKSFVKPGHWFYGRQRLTSNNYDAAGTMETSVLGAGSTPIPVGSYFHDTSRIVTFKKGEEKQTDFQFFLPNRDLEQKTMLAANVIRSSSTGSELTRTSQAFTVMPDYQFVLAVAAQNPNSYGYLKVLDSVRVRNIDGTTFLYQVSYATVDKTIDLPFDFFSWTTIAYLVWDNVDPNVLDDQQRQALLDWLQWGGQLIISGPDSLDKLKGSFLEPYLPATSADTIPLTQEMLNPINEKWGIRDSKTAPKPLLKLNQANDSTALKLELNEQGEFIPSTGELIAEGRAGRGRVVITAFRLSLKDLLSWSGFDGFFHSCILRKPPRKFLDEQFNTLNIVYAPENSILTTNYATNLRVGSRDASRGNPFNRTATLQENGEPTFFGGDARDLGFSSTPRLGVAAWNDVSDVSETSWRILSKSSGISPPSWEFVLQVAVWYIIAIVPVNWLIFRLLGRLEWAWVALPIVSIITAIIVIRLASLDIGFARSNTEVAVLEVQPSYARGHLTRYTTLYTSLGTNYAIGIEANDGRVLPFRDPNTQVTRRYRTAKTVQGKETRFEGFQVDSNSADTLHSEQFISVGDGFVAEVRNGKTILKNGSDSSWNDAGVLYRSREGKLEFAWIGKLAKRSEFELNFAPISFDNGWKISGWSRARQTLTEEQEREMLFQVFDLNKDKLLDNNELPGVVKELGIDMREVNAIDQRRDRSLESTLSSDAAFDGKIGTNEANSLIDRARRRNLHIGELFYVFTNPETLAFGEMRLVAWSNEELPGLEYRPKPSQRKQGTVLVAHLQHGRFADIVPDVNNSSDATTIDETLEAEANEEKDGENMNEADPGSVNPDPGSTSPPPTGPTNAKRAPVTPSKSLIPQ